MYYRELYEQNKKLEEKVDELIKLTCRLVGVIENAPHERKMIYGIEGLADFLCCSLSTAKRIKAAGILAEATIQFKKTIVFDEEKVVELLGASNNKWSYLVKTRLKSKKM